MEYYSPIPCTSAEGGRRPRPKRQLFNILSISTFEINNKRDAGGFLAAGSILREYSKLVSRAEKPNGIIAIVGEDGVGMGPERWD